MGSPYFEAYASNAADLYDAVREQVLDLPTPVVFVVLLSGSIFVVVVAILALFLVAPVPRPPRESEKTFQTILPDGTVSERKQLPCWIDSWKAQKEAQLGTVSTRVQKQPKIEDAEIHISVVVPAYNEQERLGGMLEEAVDFLMREYGDAHGTPKTEEPAGRVLRGKGSNGSVKQQAPNNAAKTGWEILVVSDGSKDKTIDVALSFAKEHQLSVYPQPVPGPWKKSPHAPAPHVPHGSIRVVQLEKNRGKGGAVTHGMRHVRGEYVVFADADGASNFEDLAGLIKGCKSVEDNQGRAVAIGSRAHLVGSEAVVKRSKLRNFLMHSFHLLLRLMTPPATAAIRDTQCGFKLFSRPALPYIIPYMHSEGWIFDVEMLMLAESANIPMVEVAIGWKEVMGSKLNVIKDSVNMAWDLAVLRAAWGLGVYRRS